MKPSDLIPQNWFKKNSRLTNIANSSMWNRFNHDINKVFEDFAKDFGHYENYLLKTFKQHPENSITITPKIDLSENEKEYIIEAELPGVKDEDVDISFSNNDLTIKGKREAKEEVKKRDYYRLERSYGSFETTLPFPENASHDNIEASLENGILTIKIPKKELSKTEVKKINLINKAKK